MRHNLVRFSSTVLIVGAIGTVLWVNAGSLTPPAGPVAPTMKTLQQVEPRTDVQTLPGDVDALYIISESGSYYLTDNVTGVAGKNGIRIEASDVTLDLRGFTLQGVAGSGTGIWGSGGLQNITITNGTVSSWGIHGVDAGSMQNSVIEGIRASDNASDGIRTWGTCAVKDCVAKSNQNHGFSLGNTNTVSHCTSVFNWADGFTLGDACAVSNCVAESNGNRGFAGVVYDSFSYTVGDLTFTNCTAAVNSGDGFTFGSGSTFSNCTARANGARGFGGDLDGGASGDLAHACTFLNCSSNRNFNDGFFVGDGASFNNCASTQNGVVPARPAQAEGEHSGSSTSRHAKPAGTIAFSNDGINCRHHCTITGCSIGYNSGEGIEGWDNLTITDTTSSSNWGIGLYFSSGVVSGCTIHSNGTDGISVFVGQMNIVNSSVTYNGGHGILLKEGCKVENCIVANNGLSGIIADLSVSPEAKGCQIRNNDVRQNANDGILVISNSVVEGNHCEENGSFSPQSGDGAGIIATGSGNRIDNNHLMRNDRGLEVTGASNLITRQAASGNTTNYEIAANNTVAVIVAAPVSGAISGTTGGAGIGTTDPSANVSY